MIVKEDWLSSENSIKKQTSPFRKSVGVDLTVLGSCRPDHQLFLDHLES